MTKITILHEYPVVLTKDADWMNRTKPTMKPGAIVILPADAVLVIPPENIEVKGDPITFKQDEIEAQPSE